MVSIHFIRWCITINFKMRNFVCITIMSQQRIKLKISALYPFHARYSTYVIIAKYGYLLFAMLAI